MKHVEVQPFSTCQQYEAMVDYFVGASDEALLAMGVDRAKLPRREDWITQALADHERPAESRDRFYLAWLLDGEQVGHSSLGNIRPGHQAYLHLHMWRPELRRSGVGTRFLKLSIEFYFKKFDLQRIVCEPYAENAAPNRVLTKLGFRLIGRRRTVPGPFAFEQEVNEYELVAPLTALQ
ncbi:MAG: GNAT family N-acetyltransferase [Candidatus Eremiobacteraeota bacterium]|nr:GNAT family N-acetyltransferase [Candidatus Eremiobacteraeota bacterium]MBV8461104.1 GNAT family N-acetyltransferase [Candidatus Eremiobacteraeota bacterium]MBV8668053.1 GNAT family N-acetyltransferase [Candidatus Eremiobacteraeota bacterium]